jgi:tetratricopeptide (TPR) repeat protein
MRWSQSRRSSGTRVARPHPGRWAFLTATLLLGAGAVYALAPPPHVLDDLPSWLKVMLSWLQAPPDDITLRYWVAAALLILGVLSLRRFLYARLARKPGPVLISSFDGPPGDPPPVSTHDILAEFRRTLAEMTLPVPESIPSEPQQDNVLEDVRTAGEKGGNAIATIATLLQAVIRVRHAYRVSAQIRVGTGPAPCGITIHVVSLPGGRGEVTTLWSDDWTDLAERAAHVVGAFILPRSRLANRPPWTAWRGQEVPSDLFHFTQLAVKYRHERRYEEAADALHNALKLDPQNPYLRIELAQVHEQLGLHMDALAGYADIMAIESWYDRSLWRRLRTLLRDDTTGGPPPRSSRSRRDRAALLIAHYRLVSRLVSATELSSQWTRSLASLNPLDKVTNPRRAVARRALQKRLSIWLRSYFELYREKYPTAQSFDEFSTSMPSSMSHFFRFVGYCETQQLVKHYKWIRGRRRPGLPVTQTALNIMRVWAPIQLMRSEQLDAGTPGGSSRPISPRDVDLQVSRYLRRKPAFMRTWQEYYNAACAIAVAAPSATRSTAGERAADDSNAVDHIDLYALFAVRYLERAVSSTHSGYVSQYAQWLSTGDEDLNTLRPTRYFVDFLERYLPNERSRVLRPERLLQLVMSFHSMRLLQSYARLRADYWNDRCLAREGGAAELENERNVRQIALDLAENDRDWFSRLALIKEAHSFVRRCGLPPFNSSLPFFQDDPEAEPLNVLKADGAVVNHNAERHDWINKRYKQVTRERDKHWREVVKLLSGGDGGGRAAQAVGMAEPATCLRFWADLDDSLTRRLFGESKVKDRPNRYVMWGGWARNGRKPVRTQPSRAANR